jgi:flagellar biosynthesis protein FlhB
MAEDSYEERTEAPTEKRRSEARQKGNVAKSAEINSTFVLLTGILMLKWSAPWLYGQLSGFMGSVFGLIAHPRADVAFFTAIATKSLLFLMYACLPVCVSIMIIGVAVNLVQVGFLFTLQPITPTLDKLDVIGGMKRLFSIRSVVELFKDIAKLILIAVIAFVSIKGEFGTFIGLWDAPPITIMICILTVSYKIVIRAVIALLIISLLDYFYQRYEYEKKLKMTKQEIKEERKQMDGDPQIKSRVRSLQREMARRRMMQEVPKATVVVTNPTYIAIAIRYEPNEMQTPKVLAKGKRLMAERIRSIATEEGIPIIEDKPLARAMYDKVEPGFDVPMEFFTAVAEVLAYVYRLKKRNAA